jgi:hypothetical protein
MYASIYTEKERSIVIGNVINKEYDKKNVIIDDIIKLYMFKNRKIYFFNIYIAIHDRKKNITSDLI